MPPSDSGNPKTEYDFILNGDKQTAPPPPKSVSGKFFLPKKTIFAIVGGIFLLLIAFIVISSLSKKDPGADKLVSIMATAGDIVRVSDIVAKETTNSGARNITATASAAQSSQQSQISKYLAAAGTTYDPAKLGIYKNSKIQGELTAAQQNGSMEAIYYSYLKETLTAQQLRIQSLSSSKSKSLHTILESAYNSNKSLLAAPQLK